MSNEKALTEVDKLILTGKFSMWHPQSKGDMLIDYPDMRKVPAFRAVKGRKLLFVWFYACRCSRGMELHKEEDRIRYAIRASWGERPPKEIMETFLEKKWGVEVNTAIDVMRQYQPGPRIMLKLVASQQIEKVKRLLDANVDDLKTWDEKLEFIKASKAGTDLIAQLQPLTEHAALGVVETTIEQLEAEESEIGDILNSIDDTE